MSLTYDRANRALHSFPTRRSSDLTASASAAQATSATPGTAAPAASAAAATSPTADAAGAAVPGDRKSTRLNSSHVAISYAVFCLKKKMVHRGTVVRKVIAWPSISL